MKKVLISDLHFVNFATIKQVNMIVLKRFLIPIISLLPMAMAYSQEAKLGARFVEKGDTVCDAGKLEIAVEVTVPSKSTVKLEYSVTTADGGTRSQELTLDAGVNKLSLAALQFSLNGDEHHTRHEVELESVSTQSLGRVEVHDIFTVDVFSTPEVKILTDKEVCGIATELIADTRWSDVATYHWQVSHGTLTDADEPLAHLSVPASRAVTVTLTEVSGEVCKSHETTDIVLLGRPVATLAHLDAGGIEAPVVICSSITDDPAFDFDAQLSIAGNAPFDVQLSNGSHFADMPMGTSTLNFRSAVADTITVLSITDINNCPALPEGLAGHVAVIDRKPTPRVPADTVVCTSGKNIALVAEPTSVFNQYEWKLAESVAGYDAHISMHDSEQAELTTTMNGLMPVHFIETNTDGAACPDTATVHLMLQMPFRAPEGFSPNGDGTNDALVIEGLPANNMVMICNAKGEVVFEAKNYRNDWRAEGLDEGYYVCIFKGEGAPTVKQTIVIKRN